MQKSRQNAARYRSAINGLSISGTRAVTISTRLLSRERGHAEKYRDRGEPIHLIGMAFDQTKRNLVGIRTEMP